MTASRKKHEVFVLQVHHRSVTPFLLSMFLDRAHHPVVLSDTQSHVPRSIGGKPPVIPSRAAPAIIFSEMHAPRPSYDPVTFSAPHRLQPVANVLPTRLQNHWLWERKPGNQLSHLSHAYASPDADPTNRYPKAAELSCALLRVAAGLMLVPHVSPQRMAGPPAIARTAL